MTDHEEWALLAIAKEAADAAAAELKARFGRPGEVRAKSTPTDLVSAADVAAEEAIKAVLAARRPHDAILAEEGGATGEGELTWVVDPLDGTINYLFGIPHFGVSIACEDGAGALAGGVLDPLRGEWFAATRSGPATLNGDRITSSGRADLSTALLATGFAYDSGARARQAAVVARVLPNVRDIRRLGSAALDLAWTSCGRYDAYYERGLSPWDRAAGALIAARAGLEVRELAPSDHEPAGLAAAPPALIDALSELVQGE
jgi:myo-inositol-1(or 4)-monophosphatase